MVALGVLEVHVTHPALCFVTAEVSYLEPSAILNPYVQSHRSLENLNYKNSWERLTSVMHSE
jgi:hypothetical protein